MMHQVATRLAEILSALPDPVLVPAAIGVRRPENAGELPRIAMGLVVERSEPLGLGRLAKGWELVPDGDTVREDARGDRFAGTASLEVWASTAAQGDVIARRLDARLTGDRVPLRRKGFMTVQPASLNPIEHLLQSGRPGAAFPVWLQQLAYRFIFSRLDDEEPTDGGRIARVDVEVAHPPESFSTS